VLPAFSNSDTPTPEEAQAIVAAFFAQLPLFDPADADDATGDGQVNGETTANASAHDVPRSQNRDRAPGVDLSALDQ
jgi:type IV secretion system protein VirD4